VYALTVLWQRKTKEKWRRFFITWPNSRRYPDTSQDKLKKIWGGGGSQNSQYLNQGLLNAKQECKSLGSDIQSNILILKFSIFNSTGPIP
jgi:hypothetical protein